MNSTVSLSKGVFAFKKSRGTKKTSKLLTYQHWKQEEDCRPTRELTSENYETCQILVNQIVEELLRETHLKVFEDMISYIERVGYNKCYSIFGNSTSDNNDIPAACLVTGVNMPDHSTLFDNLSKIIKERITPHIARLSAGDTATLKCAIFKLVRSLINKDENEDEIYMSDSDAEEENFLSAKSPKKKTSLKRNQCHMASLATWYKENVVNQRKMTKFVSSPTKSPSKKRKSLNSNNSCKAAKTEIQPIIVIIEEVESIRIEVLQDLLLIASEYQKSIPLVFVFGVSTSPSYIHRHLSQEATSFLTMETFQAQPSSLLLSEIIDKLLMSSSTCFRLGGKVFKLLLDIFLYHDLSVQNFISSLKFCMLEHYVHGKAAFLCCSQEERTIIFESISSTSISTLRDLSSFKKLQETLSEEEVKKLKNDSYFCKRVEKLLVDLEDWYTTFYTLIKVLHCMVSTLPGLPLGRWVRELLASSLSQQVTDSEEFQSAWKFIAISSKMELMSKLEEAIKILDGSARNADLESLNEKLKIYSEKLLNHDEINTPAEIKNSPSRVIDLKPSDRFYLREKLLGQSNSKQPKNAFEELRNEIVKCFEHVFISHLKPFHSKPFHEVFFFDSIGSVKYQLLGSVRATVQTGLTDPQKYLQCKCCKLNEKDLLVTSLPDVSLCYKLHLECGRFINLYDWLQAFIATVSGDEEDVTTNKKNKKKGDEELQARFIQAVAELQLLGFIKPTKRKTDHVQRLTWGGC